jgi:hypothetical protein
MRRHVGGIFHLPKAASGIGRRLSLHHKSPQHFHFTLEKQRMTTCKQKIPFDCKFTTPPPSSAIKKR